MQPPGAVRDAPFFEASRSCFSRGRCVRRTSAIGQGLAQRCNVRRPHDRHVRPRGPATARRASRTEVLARSGEAVAAEGWWRRAGGRGRTLPAARGSLSRRCSRRGRFPKCILVGASSIARQVPEIRGSLDPDLGTSDVKTGGVPPSSPPDTSHCAYPTPGGQVACRRSCCTRTSTPPACRECSGYKRGFVPFGCGLETPIRNLARSRFAAVSTAVVRTTGSSRSRTTARVTASSG